LGEHEDRRESSRRDICWPISVDTDQGRISGETVNISGGGLSIACDEPVPMDEVLKISIMPPDHRIIEVSGKITWADLSGIDDEDKAVGMGVCFLEISEEDQAFLIRTANAHPDS
jgi:hypothetical protein